jgi:endonuclease YncB( thermonuclease family)
LAVLFLILVTSVPAGATDISGLARVIDGDLLEVDGIRIRLHGIDAPEASQTCFTDKGEVPCGQNLIAILAASLKDKPIRCEPVGRDRVGTILAKCFLGGQDLGRDMVRAGVAVSYLSDDYEADEAAAKKQRKGLWAMRFVRPEEHRRLQRESQATHASQPQTRERRGVTDENIQCLKGAAVGAAASSGAFGVAQVGCLLRLLADMKRSQTIDAMPRDASVEDTFAIVLECFHPTGELTGYEILSKPWVMGPRYGADSSILVAIYWRGRIVGLDEYRLEVGILERNGNMRAVLINDDATIQTNGKCSLSNWVPLG